MENTVRLAMGQMRVDGGRLDDNLRRAEAMIERAAVRGCQLIVLPECLDAGWTHPSARRLAKPVPGPVSKRLSEAARAAEIHVVAGLTELAGTRIYNSAVLISSQGQLLTKHRKINILDIAQDLYSTGTGLSVVETTFGTVGLAICADNFPDSLSLGHSLGRMGAQILLSPCAWAVDADYDNEQTPYGRDLWDPAYATLARLYQMPVVGVSNVGPITGGPWKGRVCIGSSLAVGAGGEVVARAPFGEHAECLVEVDLELVPPSVTGTNVAPMLREKGYAGP
jgi:predicted amidohydrolase